MEVMFNIRDNIPHIFFNETLYGIPFMFDGCQYSSVSECFNSRKYSKMLWNPLYVPYKHKVQLNPEGFLVDENRMVCFDTGCGSLSYQQFEYLVCAYLFTLYFEQVRGDVQTEQAARYFEQYVACKKLSDAFSIPKCHVSFNKYAPNTSVDECVLVCNKQSSLDIDLLHSYKVVHISRDDFKASHGVKLNSFNREFLLCIHVGDESYVDDTEFMLKYERCHDTVIDNCPIDYCNLPIVAFNTICFEGCINWDNVYYWEGL